MSFTFRLDGAGFPMAGLASGTYIGLFPLAKSQLESWVAGMENPEPFGRTWYDELLAVNPRADLGRAGDEPWRCFVTGIRMDEARAFARLCGPGYRLPTVEEWRALDRAGERIRQALAAWRWMEDRPTAWAVSLVEQGLYPLTGEGVLELAVGGDRRLRGIGRPWTGLHPNLWRHDDDREIFPGEERFNYIGMRLAWDPPERQPGSCQ